MWRDTTALWNALERRSGTVFLVAGGLMLVTVGLGALDVAIDTSLTQPAGVTAFVAIVLSFVGLLGLYPQLADGDPRLARAGILLIALPAIYVLVVLVWLIPTAVLSEWPPLPALIPGVVQWAIFVLFALGITVFGVVSLQTDIPSRTVGGFLLVLAAAWYVVLGAEVAYEPIPQWAVSVLVVLMTVALLPIGYLLRTTSEAETTEQVSDSVV